MQTLPRLSNLFGRRNAYSWLVNSAILAIGAVGVALIPWPPLSTVGGLALLILLPGLQLTRWLGLWRGWCYGPGIVLSIALGLVFAPLLLFWTGWLFGVSRLEIILACVVFTLLIAWINSKIPPAKTEWDADCNVDSARNRAQNRPQRILRISWLPLIVLLFLTVSIILAYTEGDTELGSYPIQMGDWVKHHGVAWSLRHTGVPPTDMFFSGMAPDKPLSYYYFLHLTIASLDILRGGPADVHGVFVVITIVASLCFAIVFYWLACCLLKDRRAANAAFLFATFIGGLDIIPTLRRVFQKQDEVSIIDALRTSTEHIDNWTPTQQLRLSTFVTHYLWVPQHVTGLLIVTLGLYLYRIVPDRRRLLPVLALLIATLLGHSTWIAFIVFMALPLFALYEIRLTWHTQGETKAWQRLAGYVLVALMAVLMILPYGLTSLLRSGAAQAGIAFEIPHNLTDWSLLTPFSTGYPGSRIAQLLDVSIHYFVEMGAMLIAGLGGLWLFWKKRASEPIFPFLLLLLILGFGAITFFAAGRSYADLGLVLNNDLGLRAIMPAQLVLALFAGFYLARISRIGRWQLIIILPLIVLGLASSLWEVLAMGINKYNRPPQVPMNVLQLFEKLPEITPHFSVVQHRTHDDFSRVQPGYADRFNGYSTSEAISVSNVKPLDLALAIELAKQAFDNTLPVRSYQMFLALGADYVFVGPVEQNEAYHPQKFHHPLYFTPIYDDDDVSIFEIRSLLSEEVQATFDGGTIEFLGYFIDEETNQSGDDSSFSPAFVTAWRLTHPTDKDYTVFIHLVDAEGNIMAQADHQLWAWDVRSEGPTSIWTPNLTHLDIIPVPKDALTAEGPLTIRLGLWLPDTGQHFPVDTSTLTVDEEDRLVVGELSR